MVPPSHSVSLADKAHGILLRLMEYFEGPVEISDWTPEATAAIAKPSIAEAWRE
jgi:hypothetical protein